MLYFDLFVDYRKLFRANLWFKRRGHYLNDRGRISCVRHSSDTY